MKLQFPKTIAAVNAEVARRRATGEAAPDAIIADFGAVALQHADGSWYLRVIFALSDGSSFTVDTVDDILIDQIVASRNGPLH